MTTIGCRDVLQLIAEQIDNKKTWHSFALANRTTAEIARRLKEQKKVELDFWYRAFISLPLPNELIDQFTWIHNIGNGHVNEEIRVTWDNFEIDQQAPNNVAGLTMSPDNSVIVQELKKRVNPIRKNQTLKEFSQPIQDQYNMLLRDTNREKISNINIWWTDFPTDAFINTVIQSNN
jgi:hypothetical protein